MNSFRVRFSSAAPSVENLKAAQRFVADSVVLLNRKAAAGEVILELPIFSGDWEASFATLNELAEILCAPEPFLRVAEYDGDEDAEETLTAERFRDRLAALALIQEQQRRASDLGLQ